MIAAAVIGTKDYSATAGKTTRQAAMKRLVSLAVGQPPFARLDLQVWGFLRWFGRRRLVIRIKWTLILNAEGDQNKVATMSKQLVDKDNQVLIGIATPSAQGLASTTKDKPIVMGAVTVPVYANLVEDLKTR